MTLSELQEIYSQPFFDLISQARSVYLKHWPSDEVQLCTLLSIKTGGCSEDCAYCAQSARYSTGVDAGRLMKTEEVLQVAERAKENGSTRFCMGAAWKGVREGDAKFDASNRHRPKCQPLWGWRSVLPSGIWDCLRRGS